MAPIVNELHALRANGGLTSSVSDLAASYAHMYVNRLMLAEARAQELMVYDCLARCYKAQLLRNHHCDV
jgi:hypothetical protein